MINLSNLTPGKGARKKAKRLGRGPGSGSGKTSGRGHKGQNSRGSGKGPWFEGGQTPLHRRLPKRGFHNPARKVYQVVNLRDLEARFSDGDEITPETLRAKGMIGRSMPVKLLGHGTLSKRLSVRLDAVSVSAAKAVEAAGGTVIVPEKKSSGKKASASETKGGTTETETTDEVKDEVKEETPQEHDPKGEG